MNYLGVALFVAQIIFVCYIAARWNSMDGARRRSMLYAAIWMAALAFAVALLQ